MADGSAASVSRITLQPGETLIEEGDEASSVYVLVDGSLSVSRSVAGESAKLAEITDAGSVVGEMVSMGGGTRSATVTADGVSELLAFSSARFHELLETEPDFTGALVAVAMRRAEEGELAELLASHFGIVDDDLLMSTCGSVEWIRLAQGDVLVSEGDPSDAAYFVIRGRLRATRLDPATGSVVHLGESGRGDVVGEMGLLGNTSRTATVTAVRDTVLAKLDEASFLGLVDRQPRLMVEVALNAAARSETPRWHSSSKAVVAIAVGEGIDGSEMMTVLQEELESYGEVGLLSPDRVDAILDAPDASAARRGEVGDVRLSRLIHEVELASDHVIVDMGPSAGPWARRAHGMADRLLLAVRPDPSEGDVHRLNALASVGPGEVRRTLVVVHPSRPDRPAETRELMSRFRADDVIHIVAGEASDLARLARMAVGRGRALVLSGGGGRGFAHIGVIRALQELDYPVDIVGGTSIGGVIGAAIAEGGPASQIVDWAQDQFPGAIDYTIPIVALAKGGRIAGSAQETWGQRDVEDLWLTFFCLSTNLSAARVHVHRSGPLVPAIRATSAIPGVLPPVPFGDDLLVDGGVLNNLPMDIARDLTPHGRLIAVDVAPVRGPGAHGDYGLSVSGWDALRTRLGSKGRTYPRMSAVLMRSMISASMRERDNQTRAGLADCYLDLDMRGVSMLEFDDPVGVAQRGYEAAMPLLEEWVGGL